MNILVLETSTTSAKALLYNTDTQTYQWRSNTFDKSISNGETHIANEVYAATIETACQLFKEIDFTDTIEIVSIVTTWHSLILASEHLEPLTDCYLWSSQIGEDYLEHLIDKNEFYQTTGCVHSSMYPFYKLAYLTDLDLVKADVKIIDQGSYNFYQLTSRLVTSKEMASGTGFYNIELKAYDQKLLQLLGVKEKQLPSLSYEEPVYYHNYEYCPLNQYMSDETIILPAMPDGAMNQLGSVGRDFNKMTVSVGTSGALRILSNEFVYSENGSTWAYALDEHILIGAATSGACNCIDDVKSQLFNDLSYTQIEELIETYDYSLANSNLIYLPFKYGERSPNFNNERPYGFVGIEEAPCLMYISALEGVLFNMYQCYLELTKLAKKPIEIHLSGGILNSRVWTQMISDIFNCVIYIDPVIHSSMFGGVVKCYQELGLNTEPLFNKSLDSIYPNQSLLKYYQLRYKQYLKAYNNVNNDADNKHQSE